MHKRTIAAVIACILGIVLLAALAFTIPKDTGEIESFTGFVYSTEAEDPKTEEMTEAVSTAQTEPDYTSTEEEQPPVIPAQIAPHRVIFVGDSRMVQMHEALGNTGVLYIAENAKGYDWFVEKAIPQIDSSCGKGSRIVINLGVNDPGNADKYVAMVNAKASEWTAKGAKVYYALVNPVWDNPYTTEDQVVAINNKLAAGLVGVKILDTHTYLVNNGYRLIDGLHYDGPTYASLYSYILSNIM